MIYWYLYIVNQQSMCVGLCITTPKVSYYLTPQFVQCDTTTEQSDGGCCHRYQKEPKLLYVVK